MSLKLLKQSIDIIEEDLKQTNSSKGKQTSNSNNKIHKTNNTNGHFHKKTAKSVQDVKHEFKYSNKKTQENIKRLLALSMNTIKVKDAEKIVQRAHKGRYVEKIVPEVKQESIFTEDDFRQFEEEYFN